jgi:hypothetical protein
MKSAILPFIFKFEFNNSGLGIGKIYFMGKILFYYI